ncbi:hypothetical protein D9F80_23840 [Escherichia coli]|nr:hypothetical protein [Escherichia coli]
MALYVVLYLWTVMRRAGAENSDMMIFSAWYTSGKSFIQIKSDPYETGMRSLRFVFISQILIFIG